MASRNGDERPHLPSLRGIDPTWRELDHEFATLLVKAPYEDVAEALKKRKDLSNKVRDLLSTSVSLGPKDWERAIFVFQLVGHDWTQISGPDWWAIAHDLPVSLSKRLGTAVFQNYGEGVYQGYNAHLLFEAGKQVEDDREADQAASELGIFVAYEVWGDDGGRVVCWRDWGLNAFRGALLLTLKE